MGDWRQYVDEETLKQVDEDNRRRILAEKKSRQQRDTAWSLGSFLRPAARARQAIQPASTPARPALLGGPPPRKR